MIKCVGVCLYFEEYCFLCMHKQNKLTKIKFEAIYALKSSVYIRYISLVLFMLQFFRFIEYNW